MGFFEIMLTTLCCLCFFYCMVAVTIMLIETISDRVAARRERKERDKQKHNSDNDKENKD